MTLGGCFLRICFSKRGKQEVIKTLQETLSMMYRVPFISHIQDGYIFLRLVEGISPIKGPTKLLREMSLKTN